MVLSWVINLMHVDVSSSIMYCETMKEKWIKLQNQFSQGNGPKIYNLQKQIHISAKIGCQFQNITPNSRDFRINCSTLSHFQSVLVVL